MNEKIPAGNLITGYLSTGTKTEGMLNNDLQWLGTVNDLVSIIEENETDEVILALEEDEYGLTESIIDTICFRDVLLKAVPSMRGVISGHVEAGPIYATPC